MKLLKTLLCSILLASTVVHGMFDRETDALPIAPGISLGASAPSASTLANKSERKLSRELFKLCRESAREDSIVTPEEWVRRAKALLHRGANPNCTYRNCTYRKGNSALHRAGCAALVELLLDHGANIEAESTRGLTPLYAYRDAETILLLLRRGAKIVTSRMGIYIREEGTMMWRVGNHELLVRTLGCWPNKCPSPALLKELMDRGIREPEDIVKEATAFYKTLRRTHNIWGEDRTFDNDRKRKALLECLAIYAAYDANDPEALRLFIRDACRESLKAKFTEMGKGVINAEDYTTKAEEAPPITAVYDVASAAAGAGISAGLIQFAF